MAMGFCGPDPIGWQDIGAFVDLTGTRFAPWEIEILERVDDLFLHPEQASGPPATRPMTEALFDTIFS
jgi:hypothetical protein